MLRLRSTICMSPSASCAKPWPLPMTNPWTPEQIRAEARRLRTGSDPGNVYADLQAALAMIEALAWWIKPQEERDRETNPAPKWSGE